MTTTRTPQAARSRLAANFERQITAVLTAPEVKGSKENAALAVSYLAEHFADQVMTATTATASALSAAAPSRLAAAPASTPAHLSAAEADERAWDDYNARNFGTERKYDPATGQRYQYVRLAKS